MPVPITPDSPDTPAHAAGMGTADGPDWLPDGPDPDRESARPARWKIVLAAVAAVVAVIAITMGAWNATMTSNRDSAYRECAQQADRVRRQRASARRAADRYDRAAKGRRLTETRPVLAREARKARASTRIRPEDCPAQGGIDTLDMARDTNRRLADQAKDDTATLDRLARKAANVDPPAPSADDESAAGHQDDAATETGEKGTSSPPAATTDDGRSGQDPRGELSSVSERASRLLDSLPDDPSVPYLASRLRDELDAARRLLKDPATTDDMCADSIRTLEGVMDAISSTPGML